MTRVVPLVEHQASKPVRLSAGERDALRGAVRDLLVQPAPGSNDLYILRPGSTIGVVRHGDLLVEIRPKIGPARLLFLISYALHPEVWREEGSSIAADANLAEAIVPLFVDAVHKALRPGLLHGYEYLEDRLPTIRGRVRLADQFRSRAGLPLPVEVTYDDFTPNILENRLLRTAVDILGRLYLRHAPSRTALALLRHRLDGVKPIPADGREPPEPVWTQLNERYRAAVSLARLIVAGRGLEVHAGSHDTRALLIDMNQVFERFVRVALREQLHLNERAFPAGADGRQVWLDTDESQPLRPDLSWWSGGRCLFVGDCKYKKADKLNPGDHYQMLAYLTALDLPDGMLVYSAGQAGPSELTVRHANRRIRVRTVDLTRPPADVIAQLAVIAGEIRQSAAARLQTAMT